MAMMMKEVITGCELFLALLLLFVYVTKGDFV